MKSRFVRFFFSCAILLIVVYNIKIDFLSTFASIEKPLYLIFCIIISICIIPIIVNNTWKILLKSQGIHESFFSLLRINFKSIFLGILLPSSTGFDAVRIYMIEKRNKQMIGAGGASVIIERLIGFYLLSLLGVIGAWVAQKHGVPSKIIFIALIVNIFIFSLFFILTNKYLYSKVNKYLLKVKRGGKIILYITTAYSAINSFPLKKVLLLTVPLILIFQLSTIYCGFLIFKAFGIELQFYYHLAFLPLISIISIIPLSISGFGFREGSFVYFYSLLGVSSNISFLVSLIYYLILALIPAFIGMLLYILGNDKYKSIKNELIKK